VLEDIDIEFLHDLRTSLTATRSILRLTDDVLPGGLLQRFGDDLRWLAQLTGPVRDLDLLMLTLRGDGDVPVTGLDHLEPLHKVLAARRRGAQRTMTGRQAMLTMDDVVANWRAVLGRCLASVDCYKLSVPFDMDHGTYRQRMVEILMGERVVQ